MPHFHIETLSVFVHSKFCVDQSMSNLYGVWFFIDHSHNARAFCGKSWYYKEWGEIAAGCVNEWPLLVIVCVYECVNGSICCEVDDHCILWLACTSTFCLHKFLANVVTYCTLRRKALFFRLFLGFLVFRVVSVWRLCSVLSTRKPMWFSSKSVDDCIPVSHFDFAFF